MSSAAAALLRRGRTAARQPLAVIALIPIAWVMIGLASAIIALVPFRRLAPVLGRHVGTAASIPVALPETVRRASRIGHAITIAAKYAPFRSNCLPQALVAATLCRVRGVPFAAFLGASVTDPRRPGELVAHAWVQSGPVQITGGGGNFQGYGVVACFVRHLD